MFVRCNLTYYFEKVKAKIKSKMKDIPKEGKGGWSGLVTDINIALTLPCDSVDTKPVIYLELGDNSLIWAT